VRLLLDTHVLLWWLSRDVRIITEARIAISDPDALVLVSAASAWEMSIKSATGKLHAPEDLPLQLDRHTFVPLAVELGHGLRAGSLPLHHTDPFDRMLIAQAQLEKLTIVTRDPRFALYDVDVLAA